MPKVSIILTASETEHCQTAAIEGILAQRFTDFELIVCGSERQGSASSVMRRYSDSRVKTFRIDEPIAPRYLEARAIADLGPGEYLAIPDPADLWASDQLERQVAYLDSHSNIGGILTVRTLADQRAAVPSGDSIEPINDLRWQWLNRLFLGSPRIDYVGMFIRRQSYRDAGAFRCGLNRTVDAELLSRMLIRFPIRIILETPAEDRQCADADDAPRDTKASSDFGSKARAGFDTGKRFSLGWSDHIGAPLRSRAWKDRVRGYPDVVRRVARS